MLNKHETNFEEPVAGNPHGDKWKRWSPLVIDPINGFNKMNSKGDHHVRPLHSIRLGAK